MELPKPPDDVEQKKIIDKLANFVARNGPEFEQMMKQKQKGNDKFSFLFGGEHFNYYQYRVTTEQAIMKKQAAQQPGGQLTLAGVVPSQALAATSALLASPIWGAPAASAPAAAMVSAATSITPGNPLLQPNPSIAATGLAAAITPTVSSPLQQQISAQQATVATHQAAMKEQIAQSEANLAAQYAALVQQQQVQIEEAVSRAQEEKLQKLCDECEMTLDEFDKKIQPIIDSCTKEAMLNGKNWIMSHCVTEKHCDLVAQYLMKRIMAADATFELRLHLIYLINDLLHHCQRKNQEELKASLSKVVVPVFCTASIGAEEAQRGKLNKLLNLWDSNHYFEPDIIDKLKDPSAALSTYPQELIQEHAEVVVAVTNAMQQQYAKLQAQHQDFASHLQNQLSTLQGQLQALLTQQEAETSRLGSQVANVPPPGVAIPQVVSLGSGQSSAAVTVINVPPTMVTASLSTAALTSTFQPQAPVTDQFQNAAVSEAAVPRRREFSRFSQAPPPTSFNVPPPGFPAPATTSLPPPTSSAPQQFDYAHGAIPQGLPPTIPGPDGLPIPMPDLTKPPPGFPAAPPAVSASVAPPLTTPTVPPARLPIDMDLTPSVPYYELPAGLMAPLVKLEDFEYLALDPKDIRLPPPMPPSERLLQAVEAFYSLPHERSRDGLRSHERPRGREGWEKLGLYEFFKAKQRAKLEKPKSPETKFRERSLSRSRSRSRSSSRGRSTSPSPPRRQRRRYNSNNRSRSRSRSRSQSRSPSPLPYLRSSKSPSPPPRDAPPSRHSPSPQRRRSSPSHRRSPSPPPNRRSRSRSPTPPQFSGAGLGFGQPVAGVGEGRLGEDNKGHQLLMKMGWGGKGLGASEQGIVDPIAAADVRDKQDQYKGIGINLQDPFEQFRKSKSQGFIQRMKARDDPVVTTSAPKDS